VSVGERKRSRWLDRVFAALVVAILLPSGYFLSLGPVIRWINHNPHSLAGPAGTPLAWFLSPLDLIPRPSTPERVLLAYVCLWVPDHEDCLRSRSR
jgi:hypothetical protein